MNTQHNRLAAVAQSLSDQAWAAVACYAVDMGRIAGHGPDGSEYDGTLIRAVFRLVLGELHLRKAAPPPDNDPSESKQDAVERAQELMRMPMRDLPPKAIAAAKFLAAQVGMCAETCLTAYAAYAQVVEGLPCADEAYVASSDLVAHLNQE
jgi:hypothetical protein